MLQFHSFSASEKKECRLLAGKVQEESEKNLSSFCLHFFYLPFFDFT